jgi:adenosylcobinamide-GDP ribazoletransferase
MLLVADFAAISALGGEARPRALLLAPLCGRTCILAAYWWYPYGRPGIGWSWALKQGATPKRALLGLGLAVAIALATAGAGGALLLALSLSTMHVLARLALTRVPGLTGDIHGAICEVVQLTVWLAAPAALKI